MLIGLVTEGEEEEEGGGEGKSNSKVGTRWVRQKGKYILCMVNLPTPTSGVVWATTNVSLPQKI